MEQQQQQPRPSILEQYNAFVSWILYICDVLACSVLVFLRRRFGARYLGRQAAMVVIAIPVYTMFWEGHDVSHVFAFEALYLLACMLARRDVMKRVRRGDEEHSFYAGSPVILRWPVFKWLRLSEHAAKATVEPMLVFASGLGLMHFSEPLGVYLMMAAVALAINYSVACAIQRARLRDMRDAYLDQKYMAEAFRRGNGR